MKCIVSDLDGTLLSTNKLISANNLDAISKAKSQGVEFMVATGRAYQSVKSILNTHQLETDAILMNGAQYRDKEGNVVFNIPMASNLWKAVFALVKQYDLGAIFNFKSEGYAITGDEDLIVRLSRRFSHLPPKERELVTGFLTEGYWKTVKRLRTLEELEAVNEDVLKIELFDFKHNNFDLVLAKLHQMTGISVIPYGSHSIEINDIKAQKGIMLERVLSLKGYQSDEVMVLGDGLNDISMFERFKYSIAMGNAGNIVKKTANYETAGNDEDGVAQAIHKFILSTK